MKGVRAGGLVREVRGRFAEYLKPAKKKGQFICPLCGHGKGGDGLAVVPAGKGGDGARMHCFGCGFHGDLIDLYAREHGVGWGDALRGLCGEFSLQAEMRGGLRRHRTPATARPRGAAPNPASVRPAGPANGARMPEGGDIGGSSAADALARCGRGAHGLAEGGASVPPSAQSLSHPAAVKYLSSRGISLETAQAYGLGFVPDWVSPTAVENLRAQGKDWSPPPTARIIIPTGEGGYTARAVDPGVEPRFRKMKEGPAGLFNPEALWNPARRPVFVVEGEFDALSVLEAGGLAVALGSAAQYGKLLDAVREHPPTGTLILSLDNDDAGRNSSVLLSEGLEGLSVPFLVSDILLGCKDQNGAISSKRERFLQAVRDAEAAAGARPDSVGFYLSRLMKGELDRFRAGAWRRTGFDWLDDEAGGIYPGLYVLGAISSLGKTTFVHQIADQMAGMGQHVLYFSLEQSRLELVTKSLARWNAQTNGTDIGGSSAADALARCGRGAHDLAEGGASVPPQAPADQSLFQNIPTSTTPINGPRSPRKAPFSSLDIRLGRVEKGALTALRDAFKGYRGVVGDRLSVIEGNFDCTVGYIRGYVERYVKENSVKPVVVVDYLQILQPPEGFRGSDKQAIDGNVTGLKRLSRDLDLPVIVVSSINRANYLSPIDFESFKESGGIEYTADVVWGLQLAVLENEVFGKERRIKEKREMVRKAKAAEPRKVDLVCLKNRYGVSSYRVRFEYFPRWDLFREGGVQDVWEDEGVRL